MNAVLLLFIWLLSGIAHNIYIYNNNDLKELKYHMFMYAVPASNAQTTGQPTVQPSGQLIDSPCALCDNGVQVSMSILLCLLRIK